jgi:hypothetical protein
MTCTSSLVLITLTGWGPVLYALNIVYAPYFTFPFFVQFYSPGCDVYQ